MARDKASKKTAPFHWQRLLLKAVLITLLLFLLAQIAVIWLMGEQETANAFSSGRRLLISVDSGAIEGKIISSTETEETSKKESPKEPVQDTSIPPEPDASKTQPPETKDNPPEQTQAPPQAEDIKTIVSMPEDTEETLPKIIDSKTPPVEFSKDLIEKSEFGSLPKITSKGIKPWKYYSKPITVKGNKPIISIIVTGLGQNKNSTDRALRLPEEINLSFSPYSIDLNNWMLLARLSGHEILIDLPMEAANYPVSDPGPLGLLVSKDQAENEIKIKKLMARNVGYVGFLSPQDESFLENNELFRSLLQVLSGRGLMLVVGRQPPKNDTKEMIEKGNTASIVVDTLIDEELTETAIKARLSLLEQTAKQNGYAVGVARGYPITIKQLNEWAAKATENGFNLVPVSTIVSKRY